MKIACVLGPMFEDSEFKLPYGRIQASWPRGHRDRAGSPAPGSRAARAGRRRPERTFGQVSPERFDALLIPGGSSPDKLRAHDGAVAFTRSFMDAGNPSSPSATVLSCC